MTQGNMCDTNDQLSTYLMDAPIESFTGLLMEPHYFKNNMVITTSRVSEEQTDYTWGEAIVTSDMELNNVYDETINKEETPLNSNNEIELEEHWDIDLLSFLRGGLGVTPYRDRDITKCF